MRIISLIASATEIVSALGFESSLVGRSHECDFPESVKNLPECTKPKFDISGSSREIDERVKDLAQIASVQVASDPKTALSVYEVDDQLMDRLRPDVIITQSHCEVCAVSLRDVENAVSKFITSNPKIVVLRPDELKDIWNGIETVAKALGDPGRGIELTTRLKNRVSHISNRAKALPKPTVAYLEWIDPLMAGGNWMPELVELAGGINLFGEAGKHSPWMEWEDLVKKNPDVVVIAPCGFDINRSLEDIPVLTQRPEWNQLKAVQNDRVFVADGNQFFNRPGPRVVESLEILAEIFHSNVFNFNHKGTGWISL